MILEHYNQQISSKEQNGTDGMCIYYTHSNLQY